ncbi:17479_t:CDS:2 [Gigaspora rosea]|nr:17479_t:CDS:2 [Gigaspora rosea]
MVSQEDLSHQEIEHEQSQSCEHEMQTYIPVPNRRALAQQERRKRERLENIANQGSTSHQEIEPGQTVSQQKRRRREATENSVNRRSISQQLRKENERNKRACTIPNSELSNEILREHHAFYPKYQQAYEILSQESNEITPGTDLSVLLHFNTATDRRRYNLPSSSEVAVILPGNELAPEAMRDIILRLRGGSLERLHEGHPAYLPLHYPLDDQSEAPRLTQMVFYSFRLFSRSTEFSLILRGGKLFQEFIVDGSN